MGVLGSVLMVLTFAAVLYGLASFIKPFWLIKRRWQGALLVLAALIVAVAAPREKPRRPPGLTDAQWADRLLVCDEVGLGGPCANEEEMVKAARRELEARRLRANAKGAAPPRPTQAPAPRPETRATSDPSREHTWVYATQEAVRAKMRDPQSVKFRNVAFHRGVGGAPMVCGEVNGRNGFGGYAGFQPFIASGDAFGPITPADMQRGEFEKTWKQNCTN